MKKEALFNVIIPTRERADTLIHALRTVVSQNYESLNIIVCDNYSQDNTKEVVSSFADNRIKYINTGKRVSMSHNWEFALDHVEDGWVSIIGDDDGLLPDALKRINEVIDASGALAITTPWCHYKWPNFGGNGSSELTIPMGLGWAERNAKEWLAKLMNGHAHYADLPWIYTGGFVHLSAINKARSKNGTFFQSCNPDIYSAIALASVDNPYVYLNEPVAIAGVSAHSNGASCLGITSDKKPEELFYSEKNIPFHYKLGSDRISSLSLLVYESYLQAEFLHKNELKINIEDQLAMAISKAEDGKENNVYERCKSIAMLNGANFHHVEIKLNKLEVRKVALKKFRVVLETHNQIVRVVKLLFRGLKGITLYDVIKTNGAELGARNVYDISLVAYVIRQTALRPSLLRKFMRN